MVTMVTVFDLFCQSGWTREDVAKRGDTPVREYASRADLMMVLEDIESILIRSQYDTRQTVTRYGLDCSVLSIN